MTGESEEKPGNEKRPKWLVRAAVCAVLAVHLGLLVGSALQKSATSDEPFHIARGVSALFSGDFRMSVAHPPLVNVISALPLLAFPDLKVPFADASWHNPKADPAERKYRFSRLLLWTRGGGYWPGNDDPLRIIFWCRVPTMIMSVALGLLVYLWSRRTWGRRAGLAALILYCLSPTVLAHARLATTDVGSALFIFLFAMTLARHVSRPSWNNLLLCGAALGLAELSKYTAILLIPLIPLVLIVAREGPVIKRLRDFFELSPGRPGFLTGAGGVLIMFFICALVIWAGYGFEIHSIHKIELPDPGSISRPGYLVKSLAVRLMASLPVPPRTYYFGLSRTLMDTALHPHPLYFLGKTDSGGWWYYYPVLFVLKEPLSLLALAVAALVGLGSGQRASRAVWATGWVLCLGIVVFFMFLNHKNIGIRHLLVAYPFVFFGLSRVVSPASGKKWVRAGGWILVSIYAINGVQCYPDYLVHFNSLAGGPEGGLKLSVVGEDWGQDVYALGKWARERRLDKIYYEPYGNSDPGAYGVPYARFSCHDRGEGFYAFHVVDLRRPRSDKEECYHDFLAMEPVAVLHHTIYVYHLAPSAD